MFNNQRYLTKGIKETIPQDIQIALWKCIDTMNIEKDYLQVFELTPKNGFTFVVHKQEEPEYEKEYIIEIELSESTTIFVIDDKTHSTMLLSEEY